MNADMLEVLTTALVTGAHVRFYEDGDVRVLHNNERLPLTVGMIYNKNNRKYKEIFIKEVDDMACGGKKKAAPKKSAIKPAKKKGCKKC